MPPYKNSSSLSVWFPAIRSGTGTDVFTETLAEGLRRFGVRAEITWLPPRAEYAPWTVPIPKPSDYVDVIHINTWLHTRFTASQRPIVATAHHSVHDSVLSPFKTRLQSLYHRIWVAAVEQRSLRAATKITAVSNYTAQQYQNTFDCKDIRVIYNGIDTRRFHPLSRKKPHNPFRLFFAGKLSARKGADLLPVIMRNLGKDFSLFCAGELDGKMTSGELPENMFLIGRMDSEKLVHRMQSADALIFPTRMEGFGLAAAEAQACGLPVIASCCSSLPEVVENGVTGLLCPCGDAASFAQAARRLANNFDEWQSMSREAVKRAKKLFSINNMVSQYMRVYEEALSLTQ